MMSFTLTGLATNEVLIFFVLFIVPLYSAMIDLTFISFSLIATYLSFGVKKIKLFDPA